MKPARCAVLDQDLARIVGAIVLETDDNIDAQIPHSRAALRLTDSTSSTRANDTGSHGVSDPPDRRGAIAIARAGVAHAMVSCSDLRPPGQRQWAAKSAARRAEHMRVGRPSSAHRIELHAQATGIARPPPPSRLDSGVPSAGDDLLFRGRPPGRPLLFGVRRRQPGARDAGIGARARCIRHVRGLGRGCRQ